MGWCGVAPDRTCPVLSNRKFCSFLDGATATEPQDQNSAKKPLKVVPSFLTRCSHLPYVISPRFLASRGMARYFKVPWL